MIEVTLSASITILYGKRPFCLEIPGAGKSMLTSILVEHQLKLYRGSIYGYFVGVAYIYCDYQTKGSWKPGSLLASFLMQFCCAVSPLPEALGRLYNKHMETTAYFEKLLAPLLPS